MKYKNFGEFVDKKKREALKQLSIIERLLAYKGFQVQSYLNEDSADPYIFCFNPRKNTDFDGLRIYKIGTNLAFRIQKESETHPYGSAYALNIEEMFEDLLSDEDITEEKAGKKVIEAIAKEINSFFNKSEEAEAKERENSVIGPEGGGSVSVRSLSGTDYSSLVHNKA